MTASKRLDPVRAIGLNRVLLHGSFRPNGAGGIVAGSTKGKGFSVARDNVGLYTVTFADVFPESVSFLFGVRAADATPTIVQGGDFSAANKTLQIRLLQEAAGAFAVADMAADVDAEISFTVIVRNTSVAY